MAAKKWQQRCSGPAGALLGLQFVLVVLFGATTKYDDEALPTGRSTDLPLEHYYPMPSPTVPEDDVWTPVACDDAPGRMTPRGRPPGVAGVGPPGAWRPGQARSLSGNSVRVDSARSSARGSTAGGSGRRRRASAASAASAPRNVRAASRGRGAAFTGRRVPQDVVLGVSLLFCQTILATLFLGLVVYDARADARRAKDSGRSPANGYPQYDPDYPMFQDVHVMIFVGFGFLMMFLRKYGYSAVGFTLLLSAVMVQWATLCQGFFSIQDDGKIHVSMVSLLNADVATASVLISMGAVLGKTTPLQLVVMGVIEMVCFAANEHLLHALKAVDLGGSMIVHVFGAYFGLAVSRVLGRPANTSEERSSYTSDMFAMIGTVFLWLFWPSFNGALAFGHARHRAVINTYLALAASCVTAYAVSSLTQRRAKFNMVHVQNATLAGGVAMGTAADLMVQPVGALVIGGLAGVLSVLGYAFLQPVILNRLKIHDTCGVHNLHGMPGVMAAVVGAIMAAIASEKDYGIGLYLQFPAMSPKDPAVLDDFKEDYIGQRLEAGDGRSALQQAGYQLGALAATLLIGIVSGTATGFVIKQSRLLRQAGKEGLFEDGPHWDLPDEDDEEAAAISALPTAMTSVTTFNVAAKVADVDAGPTDQIPTVAGKVDDANRQP